jgi:hypothetical protein
MDLQSWLLAVSATMESTLQGHTAQETDSAALLVHRRGFEALQDAADHRH